MKEQRKSRKRMGMSISWGRPNQKRSLLRMLTRQPRHTWRMISNSFTLTPTSTAAARHKNSSGGQPSGPLMSTKMTRVTHLQQGEGGGGQGRD